MRRTRGVRAMGGVLSGLWLAACSSDPNAVASETTSDTNGGVTMTAAGQESEGSGAGTTGATTTASTTATDTTTTTGSSSEGFDPPVNFDLGGNPDSPPGLDSGCHAVDFLFVIDNSGSMSAQQAQLLNSFNGFITAIQDSLDQVDSYHVGVITSDNYTGNAPGCQTIGDLVSETHGFDAANQVCTPFADGYRFATDDDDLIEKFPCMAHVGTGGSPIEQPVTALIAALDPAKAVNGGCNEQFIRDEAILVVVIVTDDPPYQFDMDDAHPNTDTTMWHDLVVEGKNGNEEAIVVIGFIPWMNIACTAAESPNLIGFVDSFGERGVKASVCEPDYGPLFAAAIDTIEGTCSNFTP
ncbi:MAG: VWA domain-containing protein [Deltaproteobacteria bacterium]|nr:VWA domain-containing protein [Deltaproteobacteria bacterium]MBK8719233.1 VWA domain-containing protein [Deltaproteobacteria bacterium]MBP7287573.1 VWA domain-containing protein [Nannocystaceae bacterium]